MYFLEGIGFIAGIITISSVIEIIKKRKANSINRLSDNLFTDRVDDINEILNLINCGENFIIISDDNKIKGKTWLSKKICDYINHPKDASNYSVKRCNKKKAFYFDLKNNDMKEMELKFLSGDVDSNTVCVFDHCENSLISTIKSKQNNLHFSSIVIFKYIDKKAYTYNNIKVYNVSSFPINKISELQSKIQDLYTQIDDLSKNDMETLYNLTDGNIEKISFMLNSQETVLWIKQKTHNQTTDYDEKIDKIQIDLFNGSYQKAYSSIMELYNSDKACINANNDYYYKFMLLKADCLHLLNKYDDAIQILETVISKNNFSAYNLDSTFKLKLGHFYKHIWESNQSIDILNSISNTSAYIEMLGILSCKYFIDENISGFNGISTITLYKTLVTKLSNKNNDQPQRIERHQIIVDFYNNFRFERLVSRINHVIDIYKMENSRLIANAVFLKGELFRLNKKYDQAIACYNDALTYTDDNNIKLQVNAMLYYLKNIKNIDIKNSHMSIEEITNLSKAHNNKYILILLRRINSIMLKDPDSKKIYKCFEERIMPIL